jgi:hypothetical protein
LLFGQAQAPVTAETNGADAMPVGHFQRFDGKSLFSGHFGHAQLGSSHEKRNLHQDDNLDKVFAHRWGKNDDSH